MQLLTHPSSRASSTSIHPVSQTTRRSSRNALRGIIAAVVGVMTAGQALAVPIDNWNGESGAFGDASKWFDGVVPDATKIALLTDGGTGAGTTVTISAGDNFHVRELNIGNGESSFADSFAFTGSATLNQSGGTILSDDWFTVGRLGADTISGNYNMTGGTASKAGGGLFSVCLGNAGASAMTMSGASIFNNTGGGDTRIGAGPKGGTLTMSGTSQLNHTTTAQFKVGDGFSNIGGVNFADLGRMTMNDSTIVTVHNAVFISIFGADGMLTMNGNSKIVKPDGVGQFAVCDSFFRTETQSVGVLNMHDNASIDLSQGSAGIDGEFWVGQGLNGTGTLNMDGTSSIRVRNRVEVGRGAGTGTFNLTGNATFTIDGAFSDFSVGIYDQGKGVVNQTGGTLNVATGYTRIGDGFNDTGTGGSGRLAPRSDYNLSGGTAHFGVGIDMNAFGDASALLNITGGAGDAGFMFLGHPDGRGNAELRISGGSLTINGDSVWGASQSATATAVANISGGLLKQTVATGTVFIGDQNLATLNLSGTGRVEVAGAVLLGSRNASESNPTATPPVVVKTGTGIVNLNGGTLAVGSLRKGLGNATVNFNGGVLQALNDEPNFIRNFLPADLVAGAGHAIIDSNGHSLSTTAVVTGTGGLTKVGAGTLELTAVQQYTGRTRIEAGTLRTNATTGVSKVTSLQFAGTAAAPIGTLDIAGKPFVIDYTGTNDLNVIRQEIKAGTAAGSTGGITSAGLTTSQGVGYAERSSITNVPAIFGTVDSTSVLLRLTLKGDANIDGTVDFADLLALAQSYGGAGKFWVNGDSNYDGAVDFADLLSLAQNYNMTAINSSALVEAGGQQFVADFALAQSLVPEPTTLGLIGGVLGLGLSRRRNAR